MGGFCLWRYDPSCFSLKKLKELESSCVKEHGAPMPTHSFKKEHSAEVLDENIQVCHGKFGDEGLVSSCVDEHGAQRPTHSFINDKVIVGFDKNTDAYYRKGGDGEPLRSSCVKEHGVPMRTHSFMKENTVGDFDETVYACYEKRGKDEPVSLSPILTRPFVNVHAPEGSDQGNADEFLKIKPESLENPMKHHRVINVV